MKTSLETSGFQQLIVLQRTKTSFGNLNIKVMSTRRDLVPVHATDMAVALWLVSLRARRYQVCAVH